MDKQNTNIESDPNPFPKFDIIPGIGIAKKLGGAMLRVIYFFPINAPECMSNHFTNPLDDTFDQPQYQGTLWDTQEIVK